uniref:hypothetical protein n=1 Tax=Providencia alcalifaciens TaxID=126385 RepID=UPI002B05F58E
EYDLVKLNHDKLMNYLFAKIPDKDADYLGIYSDYYKYIDEGVNLSKEYDEQCDKLREIKAELIALDKLTHEYSDKLSLNDRALYAKWESEHRKSDDQHNFDTSTSCIAEHVARMNKDVSVSDHVKSADTINFGYQVIFGVPVHITGF